MTPGLHGTIALALSLLSATSVCLHASEPGSRASLPELKRAVLTNYAQVMAATCSDALTASRKLETAVDELLARPSEHSLAEARKAWIAARIPYSQSEAARFYDGPIDQVEARINSWPIDENYIDYISEDPNAGIINSVSNFPTITRELILSLNEKEGKKNISTGFHAIEFLLWGQDFSATGPGNRPWRDFTNAASNGARRRQYLAIVTELLVEDLGHVAAEWASSSTTDYRAQFLRIETDAALGNILKGLGALSGPEVAGERLTVAYETKEQEEEQDCFSDNTRDDIIADAVGIRNIYLGRYESVSGARVQGPGVHDLLLRLDPELAAKLAAQTETAVNCARNIPQPFDQAILGPNTAPGRVAIKNAITAFQTESDLIARAAAVLSIKLTLR
jgi:putative iron-regulated protein